MDDYRQLGTTDGIRWAEHRRELAKLIAQGLEQPEIKDELRAIEVPATEVARAVGDNPDLLASYRSVQALSTWLSNVLKPEPRTGRRWYLRLPPFVGLVFAVVVLNIYADALREALPRMPLAQQLVGFAGLACVLVLCGGTAKEDMRMVRRMFREMDKPYSADPKVLDHLVLPELRQYLAELRKPLYGTTLAVNTAELDLDDETPTVVTSAGHQLRRILKRPAPEAVAIAGPRGVGKTTVIRAAADGMFTDAESAPPLSVVAAAPSRYEARDFVLHLHATLCQEVITLASAFLLIPARRRDDRWNRQSSRRSAVATIALIGVLNVVALALWNGPYRELLATVWRWSGATESTAILLIDGTMPNGREQAAVYLIAITIILACAALFMLVMILTAAGVAAGWRWSRHRSRVGRYPGLLELRTEASEQLRRIRFLQTYTRGWSGKIGLPLGSDGGWNASVQRAEQNLTHPEVVESFRGLAERSARTLIDGGIIGRLVIAVDELDKIAEPAQAHELVNDIKGIFDVPNCLFLVSVSEDAMSAFERRGIPVRDAFDSAFTQMVRMDHFTLAESRRWLSRRLLGVPEQFTHLLHCLSGGLPRELRRATIELVDIVAEDGRGDLAYVTGVLLGRELDRKAHAFVAAARRFDDTDELSEYVADLMTIPDACTSAEQVALAAKLKPGEPDTELRGVRWQSACFLLFCATVREIFDNTLDESGLSKGVESLALARAQLAVDPQVAWRLVESVRAAADL